MQRSTAAGAHAEPGELRDHGLCSGRQEGPRGSGGCGWRCARRPRRPSNLKHGPQWTRGWRAWPLPLCVPAPRGYTRAPPSPAAPTSALARAGGSAAGPAAHGSSRAPSAPRACYLRAGRAGARDGAPAALPLAPAAPRRAFRATAVGVLGAGCTVGHGCKCTNGFGGMIYYWAGLRKTSKKIIHQPPSITPADLETYPSCIRIRVPVLFFSV